MSSDGGGPDDLTLRELVDDDLDAVARIEASANPQPWSRQLFAEELSLPPGNRHWLVAVEQVDGATTIVGFGGVMYAPDAAHLMLVAVAPLQARRGIAQRLCAGLFTEARTRGAEGVTLEVRASNSSAIALYEKLGMTSIGARPGYYPDGEDALIFWIHDLQSPEVTEQLEQLSLGVVSGAGSAGKASRS